MLTRHPYPKGPIMFKALRELLRQIRQFSDMLGIDLRELADIGRSLAALRAPPPITDGPLIRDWLRDLLAILVDIAEETPTAIDDSSLDILGALLENDSAWALAHRAMCFAVPCDDLAIVNLASEISQLFSNPDADPATAFCPSAIDTALQATVDIVVMLTPQPEEPKETL